METWPTKLPLPSNNYSGKPESPVLGTKMDSGYERTRKRFTVSYTLISAKWSMTDLEYRIFQAWFAYKINSGQDRFDITLPTGDGLQTVNVKFKDAQYAYAQKPVLNWDVSATLICVTTPPITESELNALLA